MGFGISGPKMGGLCGYTEFRDWGGSRQPCRYMLSEQDFPIPT